MRGAQLSRGQMAADAPHEEGRGHAGEAVATTSGRGWMAVVRRCGVEADGFGTDAQRGTSGDAVGFVVGFGVAATAAGDGREAGDCRGGRTTGVDFLEGVLLGARELR